SRWRPRAGRRPSAAPRWPRRPSGCSSTGSSTSSATITSARRRRPRACGGASGRSPARWGRVLLAAISGLALAAAFPALDWEPLAWVGLVPLLVAVRDLEPPAAFGLGWLAGFAFYLASVYWVAYTIVHYTALPLAAAVGVLVLMVSVLACYLGAFA